MKTKTTIILALALLATFSACTNHGTSLAESQAAAPPVIRTAKAELSEVSPELVLPARVQPDPASVVRVYPPAGGRLLEVKVHPGDRVRKGQLLAVLESSDIAQAHSDYTKAQAEFDKNQRALDRSKLLFEHKVLSEREYEEQKAAASEAKSELDRAADRLRILGASVKGSSNQVMLLAPRDGVVLDLGASGGELSKSTDNAVPICTIADLRNVWVVGDIFEKDVNALDIGTPVDVTLNAYPGKRWSSRIAIVSDTVDQQTRTLKVRVVLANTQHQLKPEMFANIHVRRPPQQELVLPASAVLREGGDTSVMVETQPGRYERRLVAVDSSSSKTVVIASGLKPGEIVVTEGAALLYGGGGEQ
jgi:cobalt-zinc-cadmium efflux system membrane fusion protein